MSKISGILASSPRVESADFVNEKAVRPGAPSIGQPVAELRMRPPVSRGEMVGGLQPDQIETGLKNARPKADEKTIQKLSDSFFMKNPVEEQLAPSPDGRGQHISVRA